MVSTAVYILLGVLGLVAIATGILAIVLVFVIIKMFDVVNSGWNK